LFCVEKKKQKQTEGFYKFRIKIIWGRPGGGGGVSQNEFIP